MGSANKKSPRSFQCRDTLWATFEEMAQELECSVDYLINDAMKQYARQRGHLGDHSQAVSMPPKAPAAPRAPAPPPAPASASSANPGGLPPQPPSPQVAPPARTPATRATSAASPPPRTSTSPRTAPPPLPSGGAMPPPPVPSSGRQGAPAHPTIPLSPSRLPPLPAAAQASPAPAPPPPLPGPPRGASPATRSLTVHYQGQAHPVTKDRFIIGRGKSSSDLTIRDPNVSRQHAMIEFSGGNFYMVDMGSTNGIEFSGQRVQRKAIQNGDVFRICDHEVHCTLV